MFYTKHSVLNKIYTYDDVFKENLSNCPACNGKEIHDFCDMDRYGFSVKTSWCSCCGLIFVNPRIDLDNYNKLYMDGFYRRIIEVVSKNKQQGLDTIPKRLTDVLSRLVEIYKNKEIDVLDVGGTAGIYNYLNEKLDIKEYLCVNPGASEADILVSSNVKVVNSTIEEYHAYDKKYDLIILFGTVSHLMSPYNAFLKSKKLLKDDGLFVIDFKDSLERIKSSEFIFSQLHFDHPVYFSKLSLENLAYRAGLTVKELSKCNKIVSYYFFGVNKQPVKKEPCVIDTSDVKAEALRCKKTSIFKIIYKKIVCK